MSIPISDDAEILGVVVLTRHGDRQGFYQDPESYKPTDTTLTPLGENQALIVGALLRSRYISKLSKLAVPSLSQDLLVDAEVKVKADAGGEGSVILDTAVAIGQGMYPPTRLSNETLADGTLVTSPNGGYQYIAVESVEPEQDISLEGWTECENFEKAVKQQLDSKEFLAKGNESAAFLDSVKGFLGGRPHQFDSMWNIFDYMNVQYIHNATFRAQVPESSVSQARALANYHQWNVFSDPNPTHIRNIAGQTMIPHIVNNIEKMANQTDPLKMVVISGSYKPFISLFRMLGVAENHPDVAGIVNYAAAIVFEVRRPRVTVGSAPGDLFVRLNFRNGSATASTDFLPYSMLGRPIGTFDVPLPEFTSTLKGWSVSSLPQWCDVCGTHDARGCDVIARAEGDDGYSFNPIASGFIGAAIAFVIAVALVAILFFAGLLSWRNAHRRRKSTTSSRLSAIIPGRHRSDTESQQHVNDNSFELRDDLSVHSKSSEKVEIR